MARSMKYFKPRSLYGSTKNCMGVLVGLDIGEYNIGICLAEIFPELQAYPLSGEIVGEPFLVLRRDKLTASHLSCVIRVILDLCEAYGLLIGYPNHEKFRHQENNGSFVRETLLELDSSGYLDDIPFTLVPEKNSTKYAKQYLEELGVHPAVIKKYNHSFAAAWFSERFLLKASKNKIRKTKSDRATDNFLEMVARDMEYTVNV